MALFSATMPKQIEHIARRHLNDPKRVSVKARTATAETIRQRYWLVSGLHKLDALTRILEVEPFEAILMFVRTRTATTELAERLEARGYSAGAMNGDMAQKHREQMVQRLKNGSIDILVATDVAARGLDVERISHVVNYDIPYDTEAYIHRIGRTGRAGRKGEAILFVAPRERGMLAAIERATKQKIEPLELPSTEVVNNQRIAKFKQKISDTLAAGELDFMQSIVEQYQQEHDVPALEIAAALAHMTHGDKQLLLKPEKRKTNKFKDAEANSRPRRDANGPRKGGRGARKANDPNMEKYRLEVGLDHGVETGNIVGAIANEAGLDAAHIGLVDIQQDHSTVELPRGMPRDIFHALKSAWVCGRQLKISPVEEGDRAHARSNREPAKRKAKRAGLDTVKKKNIESGKKRGKKANKKNNKKKKAEEA
jgi:ATP-dependent RNA helicase DeaD